jgi:hypothetical protein
VATKVVDRDRRRASPADLLADPRHFNVKSFRYLFNGEKIGGVKLNRLSFDGY